MTLVGIKKNNYVDNYQKEEIQFEKDDHIIEMNDI